MNRTKPLTGELLKLKNEIHAYALSYGLDFFEVIFEVCDFDTINIVAAQGGFPSRYPHWRFGMEYDQLSKSYTYGLQKIYELVINTNPSYAYLLNANHMVDQKIVMAHVYGHSDFFKNNAYFKNTNRNMIDVMANHSTKIRRYMEKYGQDKVEAFIDKVLSLENLIDINGLFEVGQNKQGDLDKGDSSLEDDGRSQALRSFMRSGQAKKDKKSDDDENQKVEIVNAKLPTRDIMKFLADYAPIKEWESDIIGILREEAYYFLPQRLTKIMNEGWASYWHSKILTEKALRADEIIDFADHHAGVTQMNGKQLNPYKLGIELFRDIEYRWDTGRFGKDYWDCKDLYQVENWNKNLMLGRSKIFEVRTVHSDLTFIDEFLTPEFCQRNQFFTTKFNPRTGRNEIDTRDFQAIKQKMLMQLTNFASPLIEVESSNFANRGELLLQHIHYGVDLDMSFASETMKNIHGIWKRPVNLRTKYEDKEVVFHFNGTDLKPL